MANNQISLLELIKIFTEYRNYIIVNIKHLQENYHRTSIKRLKGVRDENGELIQPWLRTENIDKAEYVGMGDFKFNRNNATINMLVRRKIKLVKLEDKTPILEVAGLLVNDLNSFNNYTIVSDGKINVKSLQVKISSKKLFELLKAKSVLEAEQFDFRSEHIIELDKLPLVPINACYSSIDGLFQQLAEIKVLSSILSACLKGRSDVFVRSQIDELQNYYLSKNIYTNFPTTNEYINLQEAIANGTIDSRVSYKIDIGSKEILNLGKLPVANKFLDRMYRVYDKETGKIFTKPRFEMGFNDNIAFRHKLLSSRFKITKVDELMKSIFDDFLGLEENGIVTSILAKVGAESLMQVLQDKHSGKYVGKEEIVAALTAANSKLEQYVETIYREKISPLVFYIGATGNLPDEIAVSAIAAQELAAKYPNLQFSQDEREGRFFEVGDSIISVYAQTEYYSKIAISVED
ncbi:hypothetical protein I8752_21520 [Nostocaceae cyanobacterium CENA369]|uniref:Uncharacterized protein n=1 Tax=Dendronalium phyllosphericum CENA369 TaxID=1725256 RepID=A0A8J7LF25_9NOST|nr:hypothetical protein [Dendronalium phyllosphericum]MBH8575542.1 hypothetical protein [Dendronalium phyllosphericum CENA369]